MTSDDDKTPLPVRRSWSLDWIVSRAGVPAVLLAAFTAVTAWTRIEGLHRRAEEDRARLEKIEEKQAAFLELRWPAIAAHEDRIRAIEAVVARLSSLEVGIAEIRAELRLLTEHRRNR